MKLISLLIIVLFFSNVPVNVEEPTDFELVVFEGSDWCSNCRRFETQVLSDNVFVEYLDKENIKLTKIDFPQRKKLTREQEKTNKQYAEKYKFTGVFPTIILSKTDTLSFKNLSYRNQTTDQFIQQIVDSMKSI